MCYKVQHFGHLKPGGRTEILAHVIGPLALIVSRLYLEVEIARAKRQTSLDQTNTCCKLVVNIIFSRPKSS